MILMFPGIIDFGSPEHKKAFDPQYVFSCFSLPELLFLHFPPMMMIMMVVLVVVEDGDG